jgi:Zn-dependent protease
MYFRPASKKKFLGIPTSDQELTDLLRAWFVISLAFGIVLSKAPDLSFGYAFVLAALTVGVGFVFHEMAHKLVAQRFGCFAEFRANNRMLAMALVLSFFGFIFAAPGAVMIAGPVGRRRNGMISAAGIAANLTIALLFLILFVGSSFTFVQHIGLYGFVINSWLALFNLIPIGNFDGIKVLHWNRTIYIVMVAMGLMLMFLQGVFGGF